MIDELLEFARSEFELDEIVEGASLREHLMAVMERSGEVPKRLADAPPCPPSCKHLWKLWGEFRSSVQSGMGIGRISYTEMDAYQRLTGNVLAAWEIEAIRKLDREFVAARSKK